jgi:hypothetical protein
MLKSSLLLLIAAIVVGCSSTPDKIRQTPPKVYNNTKSPELVAACIAERYDGVGYPKDAIETTSRGDGGRTIKIIFKHTPLTYMYVVDISPTPTGSVVRFFENYFVGARDRQFVEGCGTGKF